MSVTCKQYFSVAAVCGEPNFKDFISTVGPKLDDKLNLIGCKMINGIKNKEKTFVANLFLFCGLLTSLDLKPLTFRGNVSGKWLGTTIKS